LTSRINYKLKMSWTGPNVSFWKNKTNTCMHHTPSLLRELA